MMENEIIIVRQLPIIEEQLRTLKTEIESKVSYAKSLVCTEESVKSVKGIRAELNKQFKALDEQRAAVRNMVLKPYDEFLCVYKKCVTEPFAAADQNLKDKISEVEDDLKKDKEEKVKEYFQEYMQSKNIDFLTYERAGINVTLSASLKNLKEQAKAFIDKVADDIALIERQENSTEVFVEYGKHLNICRAITTVCERAREIQKELENEKQKEEYREQEQEVISAVECLLPPQKIQEEFAIKSPNIEISQEHELLQISFTVKGTLEELRKLKRFLNDGGYRYE